MRISVATCLVTFFPSVVPAAATTGTAVENADLDATVLAQIRENYKAAKVPPHFISLAPGAVKPEGWLRDWAETSAKGISGDLQNRHVVFSHSWTGEEFQSKGSAGRGLRWPLEQSAYWLDGLVRLGHILDDQKLKELAHKRLDIVVDGVNNGGDTFIWWEPKEVLVVEDGDERYDEFTRNFNNWSHSHIGRALVAYYRASGNPDILKALRKAYADFPLHDLAINQFRPHGSATNLDPMLETYALSGDKRVLETALKFANRDAFKDLVNTWAYDDLKEGHTALYYEHARVPALTYSWTGNETALKASRRVLELGLKQHGLPVGVASGHEHLMGIGAIRGLETCDVATAGWTNKWMLQVTGEREYADQMEKALLNAFPASVSRDFDLVCYFQTMNRIDKVVPVHTIKNIEGYDYSKTAGKTLCCAANLTRMIPDYIQYSWMATLDGGLAATLYGPNTVTSYVAEGTTVTVKSATNYPFDSAVAMTVSPQEAVKFPIYLRIPGWCEAPVVQVNDDPVDIKIGADGFLKLDRKWSEGDQINVQLPMAVQIVKGETTPVPDTPYFKQPNRATPITKVKNEGFPFASVNYGPLVFALPLKDKTPNEAEGGDNWRYALAINKTEAADNIEVVRTAMPEKFEWQLDAPLKLRVPALAIDWEPGNEKPLPKEPVEGGRPEMITLVPYGSTKFRVSMFPIAADSAKLGLKKSKKTCSLK